MAMNGNSLAVDPVTGFLQPSQNYNLTGFNGQLKQAIVNYLCEDYNITRACHAVGLKDSRVFYHHIRLDNEFKAAVDNAREQHLDDLESTMFRNAKDVKGVADRIFALKSWRKERYGERTTIEHQTKAPVDNLWNAVDVEIVETMALPSTPLAHSHSLPHDERPLDKGRGQGLV